MMYLKKYNILLVATLIISCSKERINNKEKVITLKKSGIGNQIYNFAHKNAAAYGLFAIIFAVLSGFFAATLFRRS